MFISAAVILQNVCPSTLTLVRAHTHTHTHTACTCAHTHTHTHKITIKLLTQYLQWPIILLGHSHLSFKMTFSTTRVLSLSLYHFYQLQILSIQQNWIFRVTSSTLFLLKNKIKNKGERERENKKQKNDTGKLEMPTNLLSSQLATCSSEA